MWPEKVEVCLFLYPTEHMKKPNEVSLETLVQDIHPL